MARVLAGSGSVTMRGTPSRKRRVDEGTNERRTMAAFDHAGFADELVDAARALGLFGPKPNSSARS